MDFSSFFDSTVQGIQAKLTEKKTGRRLLAYNTALLGRKIFSGELPVLWVNVATPFELVNCFPLASVYSEFIGAVLSGASMADPLLEKAESAGFSTDLCSYHRALIGANMAGLLPKPVGAISATIPCDGGVKSIAQVGRMTGAPVFLLNVPEKNDSDSIAYLADRLREMMGFLEKVSGRKFEKDILARIIEKSNEAARILSKVYAFGEVRPVPYSHKDLKNFQIVMLPLMGTDAGIEVAQAFYDQFENGAKQSRGGIPNESIRLLWIQNRIQFSNDLLDRIARDFGATIVWDELNEIFWDPIDPDSPFEGLAKRMIESPLGGDVNRRIKTMVKRAVQYKIDGAIHPCHWGCRQSLNSRRLFADALEKAGVPMIALDMDCVDPRNFAPGPIITRLEAFCEMLG